MSAYNIGRALNGPPDVYDDSERVALRVCQMTYADLRFEVENYRMERFLCGGDRPYGLRFGAWLRDQVGIRLKHEDRSI